EDGVLRVQGDDGPVENEWSGPDVVRSFDVLAGFHRTFHHVGGCVFDETGPDAATGRVKCLAHHYERTGNGPVDLVMMIHYHDSYRRDGGWRIAERRVAIEWTELHPAHPRRKVRS
ncbi:MAG TPA: nuclear transport factor 2 family protein, partial [Acidimicrobiales bacterium]|nr:nuclear transport factor 2 family protein [Acidimicrobiales bacterium]